MKIIRRSNWSHEDWRGDERVVAAQIANAREAKIMGDALNAYAGEHSDDHFHVMPDDYVLKPDWKP